jgi:signal recognition particle subunit SRP54
MQAAQEMSQTLMRDPNARFAKQKKGTGKRLSSQEKAQLRKEREKEARRRKRDERKNRGQP